jgi:catechol 2,3-dioxygenase-like lactoylglutathione lyase family enzyme
MPMGGPAVPMKFEVTKIPVADYERAKNFYQGLGWRLDADLHFGPDQAAAQFTPPGSPASIHIEKGTTSMKPGELQGMMLIVDDIEAARKDLINHGVQVSEAYHSEPGKGQVTGPAPNHESYGTFASFKDPDGNGWLLQEVTKRLPGRV